MTDQSLLYIFLIIIASFGLSLFQYYKAVFKKKKTAYLFLTLRAITYSIIGILLLNFNVEQKNNEVQLNELVLAVDNSNSIAQLADSTAIKQWVKLFLEDEELNKKFNIEAFQFGENVTPLNKLNFRDNETNIANVFSEGKQLVTGKQVPLVLLSDGNVTFGNDVEFESRLTNFDVYPLVLGDTIKYSDSKIDQINLNSYAFLDNKFPIEVFASYKGEKDFKTEIQLKEKGKIIDQKVIDFSPSKPSNRIQFEVLAQQTGIKTFEVYIVPEEGEKQIENNRQEVAIEVIDESTKVLLLTSLMHPDLSAFKKSIESNQQREVEILPIQNFSGDLDEVSMLILYQPTRNFSAAFEQVNQANLPHIVVTGTKTDYQFLNRIQDDFEKQLSKSTELYYPVFNDDFLNYQQEDFSVEGFPPLEDVFGAIEIKNQGEVLMYQKVQGLTTKEPMLMFASQQNPKRSYLFGEQFWRWRAASYLQENNSFEVFDNFMNKWIGYLSLDQKKSRLMVDAKSFYKTQRNAKIKATLYDQNYELDKNSSLYIRFIDEEENVREFPMLFTNSNFEFNLDALEAGKYSYEVFTANQKLSYKGQINLISYSPELQFVNANISLLKSIAHKGELFDLKDFDYLKNELLDSQIYQPIQKENIKLKPLIDWKILFIFLILSLSLEWFFRKYNGLI